MAESTSWWTKKLHLNRSAPSLGTCLIFIQHAFENSFLIEFKQTLSLKNVLSIPHRRQFCDRAGMATNGGHSPNVPNPLPPQYFPAAHCLPVPKTHLADKTVPPKLDAICLHRGIRLVSHTIYRNNRESVCYGMSALRDYPCVELADFLIISIAAFPTDGGRINQ